MAFDTAALTDYTFAQIKIAAKHAMLAAIFGGANLTIEGRAMGRVTTQQAKDLYDWADEMETAETAGEDGGGMVLVKYGERA